MQVFDLKERRTSIPMKRDMDLIRDILIRIEDDPQMDGTREFYFNNAADMGFPNCSDDDLAYNFSLLVDEGFIDGGRTAFYPLIARRLTWNGHEFLDNIKNANIWAKTKERLKGLSSVALHIVASVAEDEVKKFLGLR